MHDGCQVLVATSEQQESVSRWNRDKKNPIELLSCLKSCVKFSIGHAKWAHHLWNEVQQEISHGQLPQGGAESRAGVKI